MERRSVYYLVLDRMGHTAAVEVAVDCYMGRVVKSTRVEMMKCIVYVGGRHAAQGLEVGTTKMVIQAILKLYKEIATIPQAKCYEMERPLEY